MIYSRDNMMSDKRERTSTFETLRLTLMFLIVLEHNLIVLTLHNYEPLSVIDNISWFIEAFTYCAVDVFFLITGYFAKDSVKLERLSKERKYGYLLWCMLELQYVYS